MTAAQIEDAIGVLARGGLVQHHRLAALEKLVLALGRENEDLRSTLQGIWRELNARDDNACPDCGGEGLDCGVPHCPCGRCKGTGVLP